MTQTQGTAVKERPILFSGEMVRAILDGRKTQTRRVIINVERDNTMRIRRTGLVTHVIDSINHNLCHYGVVGDRLWVRETWMADGAEIRETMMARGVIEPDILYRCNPQDAKQVGNMFKWKPSIHMPRWASRIDLEITDVRVQRLQDISLDDVREEGIPENYGERGEMVRIRFPRLEPHEWDNMRYDEQWGMCWDSINAKRGHGWDTNPWVWAISFKRVKP